MVGAMTRIASLLVVILLASACASDDSTSTESNSSESDPTTSADDGESTATDLGSHPEPSFTAGERTFGEVTIDDTPMEYITIVPDGFRTGDSAPVLLALPPGGQGIEQTTSIMRDVYQTEALARGWVVVSPAAPDGELFFQGSEKLIPGFIDFIESWVSPEGGGVHLAGVSNGGISSFRIATLHPERFRSLTAFPGFPSSADDVLALEELVAIPVHLFVGDGDVSWIAPMQSAANRLTDLGGDVTYEVFPNEGHIIGALSDGVRIFDELDAAR